MSNYIKDDWLINQTRSHLLQKKEVEVNIDSISEMQRRIGQWRHDMFGPVVGVSLERRILAEIDELIQELPTRDSDVYDQYQIEKECADVLVTIMAWFHYTDRSLASVLDKVQTKNEGRKWRRHGDGTGQHVK